MAAAFMSHETIASRTIGQGEDSYRLDRLTKTFPGLLAVSNVDLAVRAGEIHGIIGRNGAGKSVLMGMIAGAIRPTSGRIRIGTAEVDIATYTPVLAHRLGVSLVPQEPKFAARLSVVDNLFMGRSVDGAFGLVRQGAMVDQARTVMDTLRLDISPAETMGRLPIETQQLLAFGKAQFIEEAKVLLLDEITASLSRQRKQMLLGLLRELVGRHPERSFTLISHHVSEIMEFCDRVTVMRDAQAVATLDVSRTSARELADWIVGDKPIIRLEGLSSRKSAKREPILDVRGLAREGIFEDVSVCLSVGEVVGFAGLDGSGKDEAAEALFGLGRLDRGEITQDGRPITIGSPNEAMRRGIALLPKHREHQAVIPGRSIAENILISSYRSISNALGLIDARRAREVSTAKIAQFKVKAAGPFVAMSSLSGGNKQKVLIGRLTLTHPRLFILNEPTRGVDLATKPEILRAIRTGLAETSAVIMLTESEDEMIAVCDRILVFFRGRVIEVLERGAPGFDVGRLYRAIQGV
jgi:ABC-type sugar transport system ATPase subunit